MVTPNEPSSGTPNSDTPNLTSQEVPQEKIHRRSTSKTHPDHIKLTEDERFHIAILFALIPLTRRRISNKWSVAKIAETYGVSLRTVRNCYARYQHVFEEKVN